MKIRQPEGGVKVFCKDTKWAHPVASINDSAKGGDLPHLQVWQPSFLDYLLLAVEWNWGITLEDAIFQRWDQISMWERNPETVRADSVISLYFLLKQLLGLIMARQVL